MDTIKVKFESAEAAQHAVKNFAICMEDLVEIVTRVQIEDDTVHISIVADKEEALRIVNPLVALFANGYGYEYSIQ